MMLAIFGFDNLLLKQLTKAKRLFSAINKQGLINTLYSIFAISCCLVAGKLCHYFYPLLPGSLYGLMLFTTSLHLRLFNADRIKNTVTWCLKHMGVCFVPAGVGIMNHFELLQQFGIAIVAITFFTTFILLTLIGFLHQKYIIDRDFKHDS